MGSEEKVFIPHLTECWAPAMLSGANSYKLMDPCDVTTTPDQLEVILDKAYWTKLKALPMLSTLPAFENADSVISPIVDPLEGKDNIAELQLVTEASVVHSIRLRYKNDVIYTDVGRIVIALNPFKSRPDLYNEAAIQRYARAESPYSLSPHIYQIAAGAYKGISEDGMNQSTLITGESGAGKTESTKLLLKFFATLNGHLGQSKVDPGHKASIEDRIVMANPILEAFGNASTSRNPNSSRFGKWIEVLFDGRTKIRGASITSYMLEMPRVCEHLYCDRAYHIFYQVVAAKLGGVSGDIKQFKYLTPSPAPEGAHTKGHGKKVNDAEMYEELVAALKDYEFTANEQGGIFNLSACILFLGNISFTAATIKGGEGSTIDSNVDKDVQQAAQLLGCDEQTLRNCLLFRKLTIGKDVTEVPLKPTEAISARNGLSKLIYGSLFNWLISRINKGLVPSQQEKFKSIGILDIAGFERFDVNSFEQLLINLSNEKLQQRFNQDIIQAELEDYKKEGLVDLQLDFADNSHILVLIEGKGGLIDILDEELFIPKGGDAGFASKCVKAHGKAPAFIPPKFAGEAGFSISHFAGVVPYTVEGWLDKDRLSPPREAFETLQNAHNNVVKQMVQLIVADTKKATVGSTFKKQLDELITKIRATQSNYVRCVKPNASHKTGETESMEMLRQLKCAGIMEAIKIRKSGYSLRIEFGDFVERYAILVGIGKPKTRETALEIVELVKSEKTIAEGDVLIATAKVMAKDNVRELLDQMRVEAVEGLKRPLQPYIDAYETAVEKQNGMLLYPTPLLGQDVTTPDALEKQRKLIESGLKDVEDRLGSLQNPPGWVAAAIMAQEAMSREIKVVTNAIKALDKIKPLCCDETVVAELNGVKSEAASNRVMNPVVDKVDKILQLIMEEKDWEMQLLADDTDLEGLLEEIKAVKRDILTPSCHKAMSESEARVAAEKAKQKKVEGEALAKAAKLKAEQEAAKAAAEAKKVVAMDAEIAARQQSESLTRADTVLQKIEPKLPPVKLLTSEDEVPQATTNKAALAKSIAKKATTKIRDPLQAGPRPKSTKPPRG